MILTFLCGFSFASTTTVEQTTPETLEAIIEKQLSTNQETYKIMSQASTVEQKTPKTLETIIEKQLSTNQETYKIMSQASEEAKQYTIHDAVKFLRVMGATSETLTILLLILPTLQHLIHGYRQ
jgi:uncharacterized protein with gpF-like domain